MRINVNYQNSIQIDNIFIDPYKLNNTEEKAKYIFITHPHYDHFSLEDINKIKNNDTKYIIHKDCYNDLVNNGINKENILIVEPNKNYQINNLYFETTKSYNINKPFHPKENNYLGYIITINNKKYYIVGDSDYIDEMNNIKCDTIFIPIGGTYTMNIEEAKNLIEKIKPNEIIATHYGPTIPNSNESGLKFKELVGPNYNVKLFY